MNEGTPDAGSAAPAEVAVSTPEPEAAPVTQAPADPDPSSSESRLRRMYESKEDVAPPRPGFKGVIEKPEATPTEAPVTETPAAPPAPSAEDAMVNKIWGMIEAKMKAAQPQPVNAPAPREEVPQADEFPDLDPETYDANIVKAFNTLKTRDARREADLADLRKHREAQVHEEFGRWQDGEFAKQGLYEPEFGKGETRSFKEGTPQHANRHKVLRSMNVIAAGYHANNMPVPDREELFRAAVAMSFQGKEAEVAKREVKETLQKRTILQRNAASGRIETMDPRARGIDNIRQKLAARGIKVD